MNQNETNSLKKTRRLVGMAIFTAIVVVLQLLAGSIKIGPFAPSLVLIPVVIGAAVYGAGVGGWLGLVFGIVVLIACIAGTDVGGNLMWNYNPLVTAVICLVKGGAAGLLSGLVFRALERKNQIAATVAAAVVCPVVNTGIFCAGAVAVFRPLLLEWAAAWAEQSGRSGVSLAAYVFFGLVGVNFLLEMGINIVLSPIVVRILKIKRNM